MHSLPRSQRDLVRLAVLGVARAPEGAVDSGSQRALVGQAMHRGVGAKRSSATRAPRGIFR